MSTAPDAPPAPEGSGGASALPLPSPPGILRRWMDRHPRIVDGAIAVCSVVVPYALLAIVDATASGGAWRLAALLASAAALIAGTMLRRRWPFALLAASLAISVVLPLTEAAGAAGGAGSVSTWVALYSLAVFAGPRQAWIGFGATAAVWFALLQFGDVRVDLDLWLRLVADSVQVTAMFLIPTLIGLWVGGRRRYELALIARAQDLARERDQRARLAVSEERTRIAREMHDIVSHSLTVMITLSEGAAAQAERGSDRAPDAMRRVAETGRTSLAEMRRLLGVLRDPAAAPELAPLPGAADIDSLIAQFRDAGMPVEHRHEGESMPAGAVGLTAYRIVQEALTNVLRHAPGSPQVVVMTRVSGTRVDIEVVNRLTADPAPSADGSGRGIIGMRERAALHGGTATASAAPDGRWRVLATLFTDPPEGGTP